MWKLRWFPCKFQKIPLIYTEGRSSKDVPQTERVWTDQTQLHHTWGLLVSQALEDLHHGVGDGLDHLVVVVVEGHLDIQAHKLRQVPVGVGVLGSENWRADLLLTWAQFSAALEARLLNVSSSAYC